MATVADIIAALRIDLADPQAEVFDDAVARRAVEIALVDLNHDLGTTYAFVSGPAGETTQPDLLPLHREMLVLLAAARLAGSIKVRHADAIRFSSGDKSADLTSAFKQWAETEEAFSARYKERLLCLKPELAEDVLNLGGGGAGTPVARIFDTACEGDVEGEPWP